MGIYLFNFMTFLTNLTIDVVSKTEIYKKYAWFISGSLFKSIIVILCSHLSRYSKLFIYLFFCSLIYLFLYYMSNFDLDNDLIRLLYIL